MAVSEQKEPWHWSSGEIAGDYHEWLSQARQSRNASQAQEAFHQGHLLRWLRHIGDVVSQGLVGQAKSFEELYVVEGVACPTCRRPARSDVLAGQWWCNWCGIDVQPGYRPEQSADTHQVGSEKAELRVSDHRRFRLAAAEGKSTESEKAELREPEFPPLLEVARPDLYRANGFRLTELPVDSTGRDFGKRQQMVDMAEKTGMAVPLGPSCILSLEEGKDSHHVRDAIHRLRNPESRLVSEFFWFWPHALGQSRTDEALTALARGNINHAVDIWHKQENSVTESYVSTHNLAVLRHLTALDWEWSAASGPLTDEQKQEVQACWASAFRRWKLLLEHEAFWSRLTARIRELNDPRLTPGTARRIRGSLPLMLLLINARLAVHAAERGNAAESKRHLDVLFEVIGLAGIQARVADEALRRALDPLRQRIKHMCKMAEADAEADPVHADQAARRLLKEAGALLATVDCVLAPGHSTREALHDEVALGVLACQISYGKKTEGWETSVELLKQALPLAVSESARRRIEDNLGIVRNNAELGNDWCGEGYYDLPAPILLLLERARALADQRKWYEAISLVERVLVVGDPPLNEHQASLVGKCLAYCLSLRAVDGINAALREFDQNLPIIVNIGQRAERGELDPYTTARARGASGYGHYLKCMACGCTIYDQYVRFTFKDVPLIVCPNCSTELDRQQEERKSRLRLAANAAHRDLAEAVGLDSTNKGVEKNRNDLRELCSKASITFGPIPIETVRVPCDVGCLNPKSPRNRCWFCGAMVTTGPPVRQGVARGNSVPSVLGLTAGPPVGQSLACRLEMHSKPRITRKGQKNYVIYKHGHVEAPRCAACQGTHDRQRKSRSVFIGGLVGALAGMGSCVALAESSLHSTAPLLMFILGPIGCIIGYLIRKKMHRPKGQRSESSFAKSAEVRALLVQGWKIGGSP
jgi:hypothetical protein